MKFYIATPELDGQITAIKRKLKLSMNGVVSDTMKENGIIYKLNYGVSVPRIREIAKEYIPNHDLAQRLWMLQIRETMILATLIEPSDKFDKQLANQWAQSFNQTEIIEQTCMNLLAKCSFAKELVYDWSTAHNEWLRTAAFTLGTRITTQFTDIESISLTQQAIHEFTSGTKASRKASALFLSRLCRNNQQTASYILQTTTPDTTEDTHPLIPLHEAVKQEIIFLDIL